MTEIIGIFGLQGWGKTALTTGFGYDMFLNGYKIYSNYPLNFEYTPIKTIKDAQTCRDGYLLLDEIWRWVHARTSQSKINKEMMAICLLNRKRGISIIYNTQLPRTIDVILRDVTNLRIVPHMVKYTDGKYYIHYNTKDLLDRQYQEMFYNMPIDELGKLFNTRHEIEELTNNDELTPREKGDIKEIDFLTALKKHKDIVRAYPEKNSGLNSDIPFDVLGYGINKNIAIDVKSAKRDVYINEFGKELLNKVNALKDKKTGKLLYEPYFAFPVEGHKYFTRLYDWYLLSINDYFKYLYCLNSNPRYITLLNKSVLLSKMSF